MEIDHHLLLCSVIVAAMFISISFGKIGNWRRRRSNLKLPQGNMGWPFIGETIPFMKPHSSATLGDFLDQHITRYGKIFSTRLLGKPTIVSADPEFNRFVLQNEGRLFENSCPKSMAEIMGKWSMLTLAGDAHKEMRSIAINFMSNARLKTFFLEDIEQEVVKLLESWKGKPILSAHEEGKKFTFNILAKHLMGMDPEFPEMKQLMNEYITFMNGMASLPINIPGTAYRKALQSRNKILDVVGKNLDERIIEGQKGCEDNNGNDLLTLVARQNNLSREQILDLILGVLFAGHETTSAAIALVIYYLNSCPKAIEELREEHRKIAMMKKKREKTELNWDDYKNMEFTHCVINETLRLGNVVKFLHRRAISDVQFKGYDIPCGWEVVPIISAAHLDPSIFDDPQTYNPWRWQRNPTTITKTSSLMSFGGGPRLCSGAELSKLEIAYFLHYFVQNYNWELAEDDYPVSFPFLRFPKGLPIKVHRIEI